eukprot:2325366-Rhodomonas_salina.1
MHKHILTAMVAFSAYLAVGCTRRTRITTLFAALRGTKTGASGRSLLSLAAPVCSYCMLLQLFPDNVTIT